MDRASKYLFDIQSAISLIESFLKNIDTFNDYQNDLKTQSAVERQLAIIDTFTKKNKTMFERIFEKKQKMRRL